MRKLNLIRYLSAFKLNVYLLLHTQSRLAIQTYSCNIESGHFYRTIDDNFFITSQIARAQLVLSAKREKGERAVVSGVLIGLVRIILLVTFSI